MADTVFVYDDDCGFCTWFAEYIDDQTDMRIVGFSEIGPDLRDRLPDEYEGCSHLVTDEAVYSCGASVEEALLRTDVGDIAHPAVERLRRFDGYRDVREWAYRRGANNRSFWGTFLSTTPSSKQGDDSRNDAE